MRGVKFLPRRCRCSRKFNNLTVEIARSLSESLIYVRHSVIEALTVVSDGLSEISEKVFGSSKYLSACTPKHAATSAVNDCMFQSGWSFIVSVCNIYQGLDYQIYLYALN